MRKTGVGIKGGYCSVSDYKKGIGLIIKGDGSAFGHSIKDTATTSGGCIAVFVDSILCCFVRLALPCFPAVHGGYIRIEGSCSPAETFFVDFTVVNLIGETFRFVTAFGDTV